MTVARRLRFEILRRDGYTCRYCGASAPDARLHVDHVIPEVLGGSDEPTNLVTACEECNGGKSSVHPDSAIVADVADDALRWRKAMEQAVHLWRMERQAVDVLLSTFESHWATFTFVGNDEPVPLPAGWEQSIEHFLAMGLPVDELLRCVDVAMAKAKGDTWRYFCGVTWRVLSSIQEDARRLLEDR